mmetsp:Transcript_49424/g.105670  ORF Transcript_49424/g.105670 Transcript_49424/m.105670 type:complete len:220 (-) Transcript_49424:47-706(-)
MLSNKQDGQQANTTESWIAFGMRLKSHCHTVQHDDRVEEDREASRSDTGMRHRGWPVRRSTAQELAKLLRGHSLLAGTAGRDLLGAAAITWLSRLLAVICLQLQIRCDLLHVAMLAHGVLRTGRLRDDGRLVVERVTVPELGELASEVNDLPALYFELAIMFLSQHKHQLVERGLALKAAPAGDVSRAGVIDTRAQAQTRAHGAQCPEAQGFSSRGREP